MLTAFLVFYSFMAGMMAEWSHTRQMELGINTHLIKVALTAGLFWPVMLWRVVK